MTSSYADLVRRALAAGFALGACTTPDCPGDVWQLQALQDNEQGTAPDAEPSTGTWRFTELGGTGQGVVLGPAAACPWCGAALLMLPYRAALQRRSAKA